MSRHRAPPQEEVMEIQTEPHHRDTQTDHMTHKSKCSRSRQNGNENKRADEFGEIQGNSLVGKWRMMALGYWDHAGFQRLRAGPHARSSGALRCSSELLFIFSKLALISSWFRSSYKQRERRRTGMKYTLHHNGVRAQSSRLTFLSMALCSSARAARSSGCGHSDALTVRVCELLRVALDAQLTGKLFYPSLNKSVWSRGEITIHPKVKTVSSDPLACNWVLEVCYMARKSLFCVFNMGKKRHCYLFSSDYLNQKVEFWSQNFIWLWFSCKSQTFRSLKGPHDGCFLNLFWSSTRSS